ncbi:MAG: folylpolyglutamate synthase/dihydrofolate synthase family protein [Ruminococcus sp.]|nr:folylpolyglutamate synthase/dihydrofolate synthase family protein [Ruminococcus sp.]
MTYEQALEKIHSLLSLGSRPGLDRMRKFMDRLGNPQNNLCYIHVAGTNGKGSVCAMLSSVLVAAGYKTGLFISPYITDFRERIQINNRMIDKEVLAQAVEETFPVLEQLRSEGTVITEFEYVNALQFYIHSRERCDVVVLETGMGGLLDCTNIIPPPLCAIITTIGLDHTAVLGDTLEEIAVQKCGIIKEDSAVVASAQCKEVMAVIEKTARERRVPLMQSQSVSAEVLRADLRGTLFRSNGAELQIRLAGAHQLDNAKAVLAALQYLRLNDLLSITDASVRNGLFAAANPARLQLLRDDPIVLLDGAHNPNGAEALRAALRSFLQGKRLFAVNGMLADKDIDSVIGLFDGMFESVFTVPVDNPRAISAQQLAEKWTAHCSRVQACGDPGQGVELAIESAKASDGAAVIFGSLYLAGEILSTR